MRSQLATTVLLAVLASSGLYAAEKTRGGMDTVEVYINDSDGSAQLLVAGKVLAAGIFEKIGVHVKWRIGKLADHATAQKAFGIVTLEHAPESATAGALASARIVGSSGAEIVIYKDRVLRFLSNQSNLAGVGVGYVLAHELAHVMQGVRRHSASGILKAQWCHTDFEEMTYHRLAFTDYDVDLIHRGLALQFANVAGPAVSNPTER